MPLDPSLLLIMEFYKNFLMGPPFIFFFYSELQNTMHPEQKLKGRQSILKNNNVHNKRGGEMGGMCVKHKKSFGAKENRNQSACAEHKVLMVILCIPQNS